MGALVMAKRSCGTCRDQRMRCDRAIPICAQCMRAKRTCKGYSVRLSWPRDNDGRRAIVLKPPQNSIKCRGYRVEEATMVRRSNWDIEMYMYLSSRASHAPLLHAPVSWNPHRLGEEAWNLLNYFELEASQSLTTFGVDPKLLGELILRISQTDNSLASTAVVHSILGLASISRHGYNEQAMQLKIASLRTLARALETRDESLRVVHHIAAGMLLCSIEVPIAVQLFLATLVDFYQKVHQASCSASEWTWYINGVKQILFTDPVGSSCTLAEDEKSMLLNWLYYHDVMKRFSIRHWGSGPEDILEKRGSSSQTWSAQGEQMEVASEEILAYHHPLHSARHITAILKLMSEICDTVPTKPCFEMMRRSELDAYLETIKILDWRIRNLHFPLPAEQDPPQGPYSPSMFRLYQVAMLIYLNRVTKDVLNQGPKIQAYLDDAFTILRELKSCKAHFPMYIVGWEAREDERRAIWLEMLDKTKRDPASRSMFHVGALVQAGWAQDDLADKELDYWDKVTALVRCCYTMPSFV